MSCFRRFFCAFLILLSDAIYSNKCSYCFYFENQFFKLQDELNSCIEKLPGNPEQLGPHLRYLYRDKYHFAKHVTDHYWNEYFKEYSICGIAILFEQLRRDVYVEYDTRIQIREQSREELVKGVRHCYWVDEFGNPQCISYCDRQLAELRHQKEEATPIIQESEDQFLMSLFYDIKTCKEDRYRSSRFYTHKENAAQLYYDSGYLNLKAGEFDEAVDDINDYLQSLTEEQSASVIPDVFFQQGSAYIQLAAYDDAVRFLNMAIELDPSNKNAYFERAIAFFEKGNFDTAFQDYILTDLRLKSINPSNLSEAEFAVGLFNGTVLGTKDAFIEFIPSMLLAVQSLGHGLWAFVEDPITVSSDLARASVACVDYLRTHSTAEIISTLVPELRTLIMEWDTLTPARQGELFGYAIGKYGLEVCATSGIVKTAKAYKDLRRANALQTFEAYAISEKNAQVISKVALESKAAKEYIVADKGAWRLKNAAKAEIKESKIRDYALNFLNANGGRHHAIVFEKVLGYNQTNYEILIEQIRKGVLEHTPIPGKINSYGPRFTVDIPVKGPKGEAVVRTGWIYGPGSEIPRLTTAFVKERSRK